MGKHSLQTKILPVRAMNIDILALEQGVFRFLNSELPVKVFLFFFFFVYNCCFF